MFFPNGESRKNILNYLWSQRSQFIHFLDCVRNLPKAYHCYWEKNKQNGPINSSECPFLKSYGQNGVFTFLAIQILFSSPNGLTILLDCHKFQVSRVSFKYAGGFMDLSLFAHTFFDLISKANFWGVISIQMVKIGPISNFRFPRLIFNHNPLKWPIFKNPQVSLISVQKYVLWVL